jgi:hypothetical protein
LKAGEITQEEYDQWRYYYLKKTNKKPTKKALPNCFHSGSFLALGKAEKQV